MNIDDIYKDLSEKGLNFNRDSVKVINGLFTEEDLIDVFVAGGIDLYFKIDKKGLLEILDIIIPKISSLSKTDSYNHMIDLFSLIQNEINNYYGNTSQNSRLSFYTKNGEIIDEYAKVLSMSEIKGKGIAECAEKAALANNILLILNYMGLFDYKVNYLIGMAKIDDIVGGHAFLEFDRINSKGNKVHLIYDIANPENILLESGELSYPAIYALTDDEYESFLNGGSFDNNKFILASHYKTKGSREYRVFSKKNYHAL